MYAISRPNRLFRISLQCLFILSVSLPSCLAAAPQPLPHIDDEVKLFATNGLSVEAKLRAFEEDSGHRIVVMTRRSLGDAANLEQFGKQHFRSLKLGKSDALFLFVQNENAITIEGGKDVSDVLDDPLILRKIYDAVVRKFNFEDKGLGLERGVEKMMLELRPGIFFSRSYPRTLPWALLSLALSAALIFAAYVGIKRLRHS